MDEKAHSIVIPVKGLPREGRTFNFAIGGEFFQAFGNTQIKDADCTVKAEAVRRGTLMRVLCRTAGFVVVECDRCLDDLTLKVDMERELTVGFGSVDIDSEADEDDVVVVDENEGEVDVSQFVYDYICLGLHGAVRTFYLRVSKSLKELSVNCKTEGTALSGKSLDGNDDILCLCFHLAKLGCKYSKLFSIT